MTSAMQIEALKKVGTIVAREAADGSRVLVVMPKKVESALEEFDELQVDPDTGTTSWRGAVVTHFGAIRGKNTWVSNAISEPVLERA